MLDIIKNGYKLPFNNTPPPFYAKNNASSLKNKEFVEQSINKLLLDGRIKEVKEPPFCVNPLTVAEKHSKLRLVIDLRHINSYIDPPQFKYEGLKTAAEIFEKDDYLITFDLTSGYHHVPINEQFQKFLGFAWEFDNIKRYFIFCVLPFGLNIACWVFTKLMRQLVKKWRRQGIKCIMYLDDGISGVKSYQTLVKNRSIMLCDMWLAGLTVNFKKSSLKPQQRKIWIGFIIDTKSMNFEVPEEKIKRVLSSISSSLDSGRSSARSISKIAGQLISMAIAIGPPAHLFTKQMYKFVESKFSWDKPHALSYDVEYELKFWRDNLSKIKTFRIKTRPEITKIVYSDASGTGFGGYAVEELGNVIAKGNFNSFERGTSSTCRELLAVKYVLQSIPHALKNKTIEWFTDSDNACKIIKSGSTRTHLQNLAVEIFNICVIQNITIFPTWIPRDENQTADAISKSIDTDNWSIDAESFNYILSHFGKITIDRFADNLNTKSDRFNSKEFCPHSSGVNAFCYHWGKGEFNWICPPISQVGKAIKHLRNCQGKGILFIPLWPSAYFWPLITSDGKEFQPFVKQFLVLDPCFVNNSSVNCIFDGFAAFYSLALYITFEK